MNILIVVDYRNKNIYCTVGPKTTDAIC